MCGNVAAKRVIPVSCLAARQATYDSYSPPLEGPFRRAKNGLSQMRRPAVNMLRASPKRHSTKIVFNHTLNILVCSWTFSLPRYSNRYQFILNGYRFILNDDEGSDDNYDDDDANWWRNLRLSFENLSLSHTMFFHLTKSTLSVYMYSVTANTLVSVF